MDDQDVLTLRPEGTYAIKGAALMAILGLLSELPRRHNALAERIEEALGSARELTPKPVAND